MEELRYENTDLKTAFSRIKNERDETEREKDEVEDEKEKVEQAYAEKIKEYDKLQQVEYCYLLWPYRRLSLDDAENYIQLVNHVLKLHLHVL